jgi:phospholipid/cholesterol/gamma-HCH transport system ATP-binding protein
MPPRSSRSVLSLEGTALAERVFSATPAHLDLDLRRGEVAMVHVDDDSEAVALVNLCTGFAAPTDGCVRFLGVDWATRTRPQRLHRRRRIGAVVQTDVWPSRMTIMESILLARLYHFDRPRDEAVAEATALARLFGLPGLPAADREATSRYALVRAGCVRGLMGSPDLVLVHDPLLDRTSELAAPMAQALSAVRARGGAVLWLTAAMASQAAQFIEADYVFRLGDAGLIQMRRPR